MLNIGNLKEKLKKENKEYDFIEVYEQAFDKRRSNFHTDFCNYIEDWDDSTLVDFWEIMDEEEYNSTICANCSPAEFEEGAKILAIMISKGDKKYIKDFLEDYYTYKIKSGVYNIEETANIFLKDNKGIDVDSEYVVNILNEIDQEKRKK